MRTLGFDQPLYILPFDHRGSFQTNMFGWKGTLTSEQTAAIAATNKLLSALRYKFGGHLEKPAK